MSRSIERLFLLVKGYLALKADGWRYSVLLVLMAIRFSQEYDPF
jgi:hypothetical protein